MSTGTVASIHRGLGFLFLGLGLIMFFLAGLGTFDGNFDPHQATGSGLMLLALILLILAAIGRREALVASAVLFGLMILQSVHAQVGEDVPVIGAFHPVTGMLVLFVAHQVARGLPLPIGARDTPGRSAVS